MPTFEITGADGRKHLVEADSQPKALAQFHSISQSTPQQSSANWWEAAPLVGQPTSNSWQDAPVMKSDRQAAQMQVRNHRPSSVSFDDLVPSKPKSSVSFNDLVPTDEMRQGAHKELMRRGAMAESEPREQAASNYQGKPIEVEGPDGTIIEFPAGTADEVMKVALRKHYGSKQPSTGHVSFEEGQRLLESGNGADGPWTKYQQPDQGPWTKYQSNDDYPPGATLEQKQAIAIARARTRSESANNVEHQKRMDGVSGGIGASITGFADGIPVLGPALLGAGQRGAAIASTIINGGTYDDNLRAAQDITQEAQEAHPWLTTGSNVAGAVAGTIPMMAAAPAAFGAGGGGIVGRTLASSGSGLALGTADAGVRSGGDIEKMAVGGGYGLASGMVGPVAGKLIGVGARSLRNAFLNRSAAAAAGTTPRTVRGLSDLAARDGLDAQGVMSALDDLGPDAMLMDIGAGLQGRAGGIAASPGRGQTIIRDAVSERQAGANARLSQAVDENLGPNVVPSQIEAGIKENQRALGTFYEEAFQGAKAVNTKPIADALESQALNLRGDAQTAVTRVRGMLDINGAPGNLDPNPGTLFQTRQAIDGMMAAETNPQVVRALTIARQQIDDELARSVPNLKAVDANYAELARQREALARGQTVLDTKRGSPRPSELADEVFQGAQPQGLQVGPSAAPFRMSQGARAEVDRILGNNANDITALHRLIKTDGDWNRSRLATLFGQDKADRLFKVLETERVYADTASTVTRNSETARRVLAGGESRAAEPDLVRQAAAVGGVTAVPRAIAIKAGDKILAALLSGRKKALETELSRALSTKNRAIVEALRVRQSLPTSDPRIEAITRALMTGTSVLPAR